ncbi:DUF2516 family protein [Nocardioides sp. CPCC 205120]|uniref:DUF2516 family protein n=1 Tax=Nocardioides sp. CPCC 205120 TaxID=3406462 RepID=UPI003B503965
MIVFEMQSIVMLVVLVALLLLKGFTLVNALAHRADAYDAAGKLTKQKWTAILAIGFVLELASFVLYLGPFGRILNLGFLIAALVYLADVRPALKDVMRPRW